VSERDWERLLAEKDARIAELEELVAELLAKLGKNSLNSSLAPSRDDAETKEKRRDKAAKHARRRKKDARRKNRSKRSTLMPPEMVTSFEDHVPCGCGECGRRLRKRDLLAEPERVQKINIPQLQPLVHELRIHSGVCPDCEAITKAARPSSANESKVGPGLRALILLMVGRFHLSKRDVLAFLSEVLSVELSLGLLSKVEKQSTALLDAPYEEAIDATQNAPVVYADETSWSHGGVPGWLWCATTGHVTRFLIDDRRGTDAARKLLGDREGGVTVSDRWCGYEYLGRRQVCWAHLERNAHALTERGANAKRVGDRVLAFIKKMFRLWHRFLDGEITRPGLRNRVKALGGGLLRALPRMRNVPPVARTFINGLLKVEDALFTFTEVEGVEPTNNDAERAVRPGVLWRRSSQATRSERGRRFVERIMTVVSTLRSQGRSVFSFLRKLLDPSEPTPSLLPASDSV
jgi:transposase